MQCTKQVLTIYFPRQFQLAVKQFILFFFQENAFFFFSFYHINIVLTVFVYDTNTYHFQRHHSARGRKIFQLLCYSKTKAFSKTVLSGRLCNIWDKVFKNRPSKICGRQPLKNLKGYGLLKQNIFL